ncbi:MAG: DUF1194 domain-containing protein [Defluviimonas sp.]|uniref:DUF1194 domain-containing protein n=1 Tax=Albidovulum sp. TaxID=1872424 RepID=UPI001D772B25|nr:DUF1194 domain-containing protein [Paracoccaceae bacterium]MCC0064509.1 DUF1194 domain-containing protein [Defluviimonas sp.]
MGKHGQYRALVGATALVAALAPAAAHAACRLALLLALDVSASVDADEDKLQRGGLARALIAPDVADSFLSDPDESVALAVYEWSGTSNMTLLLDWQIMRSAADLTSAAERLATSVRSRDDMPTALGYALGEAAILFGRGPACRARTLDVSGDGRTNEGFPPSAAYRAFDFSEITVNGLAIEGGEAGVAEYYRKELIRGPGAFVIRAANFRDYERAIRQKLLRELSGPVIGALEMPAGG